MDDFNAEQRIPFKMHDIPWKVFTELILASREMFDSINADRELLRERKRKPLQLVKLRGSKKLKWSDPW